MPDIIFVAKLVDIAKTLLGFGDMLTKQHRDSRDRVANYLLKIVATVEAIRDAVAAGAPPPVERCSELGEYVKSLGTVLPKEVPQEDEFEQFSMILLSAEITRGQLFQSISDETRKTAVNEFDQAIGKFRALANRLLATG